MEGKREEKRSRKWKRISFKEMKEWTVNKSKGGRMERYRKIKEKRED